MTQISKVALSGLPERDALLTIVACGVVSHLVLRRPSSLTGTCQAAHLVFKRWEPKEPLVHLLLLLGVPATLSSLLVGRYALVTFGIYWTSLVASIVMYRMSPFHPLARYPGPLLHRLTKLRVVWASWFGTNFRDIKSMHEKYGPVVRVGASAIAELG